MFALHKSPLSVFFCISEVGLQDRGGFHQILSITRGKEDKALPACADRLTLGSCECLSITASQVPKPPSQPNMGSVRALWLASVRNSLLHGKVVSLLAGCLLVLVSGFSEQRQDAREQRRPRDVWPGKGTVWEWPGHCSDICRPIVQERGQLILCAVVAEPAGQVRPRAIWFPLTQVKQKRSTDRRRQGRRPRQHGGPHAHSSCLP